MRALKLLAILAASAFLSACSGDNNDSASGGGSAFKSTGGSAFSSYSVANATGGAGGGVYFDVYGDVKVSAGGSVDVGFTVPAYSYTFGDYKLTVSTDTTVGLDPATPVSGDVYVKSDDYNLYYMDGTTERIATGLEVKSGATIKFPTHYYGYSTYVWLDKAVVINGIVTTVAEGEYLDLESGSFLEISTTGKVTTKPATAGGNAGSIYLYADGVVINRGIVDASGADATAAGVNGGSAGDAELDADTFLYNTGSVLANGGNATDGSGGHANWVGLYAYSASLFNSGIVQGSGGNGGNGKGGSSYGIDLYGGDGYMGHTIVGGTFAFNGGKGTNGDGGDAGYLYFENQAGKLWVNAKVSAVGGDSTTGQGGDGNWFELYGDYGYDYGWGNYTDSMGIRLAGTIDLSGGNGATGGGSGDELEFYNSYSGYGPPPKIVAEMVGFANLNMNGGDGASGGEGGWFEIYTYYWYDGSSYLPVGAIANEASATLKGGNGNMAATGKSGGQGGWVDFETYNYDSHDGTMTLTNSGSFDVSGGKGYDGGRGGGVYMYGYDKLTNSGAITAKGGDATNEGGWGMWWDVEFYSSYDIVNSGAINGTGGDGAIGGGCEDGIYMYAGGQVKNSGALAAAGGNALVGSNGNGGDAQWAEVDLFSELLPTVNSGAITVAGGAKDGTGTAGKKGTIWFDWVDVTPASGKI
ncbi:MAG: hypothetical protein CVU66_01450 [Deltaproteobacteria bacterium HGW-Deltaproteobacteria-23]|nr:MAG: hypothetical protein CVU66_01450 [Deltaproteobacteria bacterium HGW-Deltaproteobacteria-23]